MLYLIAVVVVPYLAFVFLSESLDPFSRSGDKSARARWRYARRMGVTVFLALALSTFLREFSEMSSAGYWGAGVAVIAVFGGYFTYRRIRGRYYG